MRTALKFAGSRKLLDEVQAINDFRNTRVAHQEQALTDVKEAMPAMVRWLGGLARLWNASQD